MSIKLLLFLLLTATCCMGAGLKLADGTEYTNVTIISADPERMLIVHDGGGCQVKYKDLARGSLSAEQRKIVEEELRYYVERTERLEKIRAEREAFAMAQRDKGLIEFEGGWMTPQDKEKILLNREKQKVELERQRVQLAKEKAELETERLQTERARYLLEGESSRGTTYINYGYYTPYRGDCIQQLPCRHRTPCNKQIIFKSGNNRYICFDKVSTYNRTPMHR